MAIGHVITRGYGIAPFPGGDSLQLESGDLLLLEAGDQMLLEEAAGSGGFTGAIAEVLTRGYLPGEAVPPDTPDTSSPGGSPGRIISRKPKRKAPLKTDKPKPLDKFDLIPRPGTTVDIPAPDLPPEKEPPTVEEIQRTKEEILTFEEMPLNVDTPKLPPEKDKPTVEQIQKTKEDLLTFEPKPLNIDLPAAPPRPELGLEAFSGFSTGKQEELIAQLIAHVDGLQAQIERLTAIAGEQSTMVQVLQFKLDEAEGIQEALILLWMADE